jgi:hypothetical protein
MAFSYSNCMTNKVNFSTHAELMRCVGGYKAISEALSDAMAEEVPYPTVAAWAANGIPVRVWTAFIAMARDRGVEVTAAMLLETRPQRAKSERRARRARRHQGEEAVAS